MAVALMTVTLLANLGLWFAAFYGHFRLAQGTGSETYHFVTGLFAAFLSVFAHCMSMFYFIGTGKVIRETVAEHGMDPSLSEEAKAFKMRYFPVASLTLTATMATPILGGAVHAGRMPQGVHLGVAISALALNALATVVACRLFWRNLGLIARVEAGLP